MADKGIIFSAPMVRALLEGRKTQTRRLLKARFGMGEPVNLRDHGVGDYSGLASDPKSWGYPFAEDGCDMALADWPDLTGYSRGDRLYVREACRAEELVRPPIKRPATAKDRRNLERTSVIVCDEMDGRDGIRYLADDAWSPIENTREAGDRWSELFHYRGQPKARMRGIGHSVPSIHMPRWASRMFLTVTEVRVQRLQEISGEDCLAEGHPTDWAISDDPAVHDDAVRDWFMDLWDSLHAAEGERWEDNPWVCAISFSVEQRNIDR